MPKETFEAKFSNLAPICKLVSDVAREAGLSDPDTYAIELATNEAATNIIEYAYAGVEDGQIELKVEADEEGVTVVLRDWGEPFDVDGVPEKDFSGPLEALKLRGAGLRLIRGAMDEVEFKPLPGRGNLLTMRKRR